MDLNEKQKKAGWGFQAIYNYAMGLLWLLVGVFFLFQHLFNVELQLDKTLTTIFGVSCLLYGLFRIYRGYKKM